MDTADYSTLAADCLQQQSDGQARLNIRSSHNDELEFSYSSAPGEAGIHQHFSYRRFVWSLSCDGPVTFQVELTLNRLLALDQASSMYSVC